MLEIMKIIINKNDIISWKVNEGSFEFEIKDSSNKLIEKEQQDIQDIHVKSGKFGSINE